MKKSFRKTTFLSALAIAVPAMGMAQDKVEASAGADLVSGYIWRGQDLGGVSIQPTLSVSYKLLVQWRTGVFSLRLTQYQPYLRGTNRL